jgi:hypothetical protein
MLPRTSLGALLLVAAAALGSCGMVSKGDRVEYNFNEGSQHMRLVIAVPPGSSSETHQRDEQGNLVRIFRYANGEEFIIACRDAAQQPTIVLNRSSDDIKSITKITGPLGLGAYPNGTHWSRQSRDGFIVGYDFVSADRVEEFDKALHSARVRR